MKNILNNYRFKQFGDKYFITTDHGSYCILSKIEFERLSKGKIDNKLCKKLEEKEIIINYNNFKEAVRLTANRNFFLFYGTSLHIIVVTLRCNMNCVYCQASSKSPSKKEFDMDKKTAKSTVDFIFQTPNKSITIEFQGGEPLLNWNILKYTIEYAHKKNKKVKKDMKITIVTNLSLMNKDKMDFIIKNGVDVCTSLDGPKKLHDCNRKFIRGSNYEQVAIWIKKFNKEYKKRKINDKKIYALVTLTKKSLEYPKEIIDEYVKLGFNQIHLRFLNKLGVAKKVWHEIKYSVEEYIAFWKNAVDYIEDLRKKGIDISERMVNTMFNKVNNEFDPDFLDLRSPCGAVIGQLAYNYNGDIYSCDEARMIGDDLFKLGNVKKDNYKNITTSNKACAIINSSINDQYICDNCVYKPYCGICPVCNYAEQGSVIGKIIQTDRCKKFKKQFDWVIREKFINK